MVCRGLLLMLHRAGEIELPAVRFRSRAIRWYERDTAAAGTDRHDADDRRAAGHPSDLSFNRSDEHPMNRCSTASSSNIIISAMSSRWAST